MILRKVDENEAPRILIVDDDEQVLEAYKVFFDELQYLVTLTSSSQEAWKILESNKFDLIITDLFMPFLNGEELIEIIRKNAFNQKTPVMIASGNSNKIHESLAARDPNLSLLKKPFTKKVLLKNLLKVLE